MRPLHCLFLIVVIGDRCGAFVERKNNIRTDLVLYLYGALRRKTVKRAVEMRGERHAFVVDNCELAMRCRKVFIIHRNTWRRLESSRHKLAYFFAKSCAERKHLKPS